MGWVESGWRQFRPDGRPLLSPDFGYGIMQITSGMAGAFGSLQGTTDPSVQSQIAGNYTYNIAFGARMLAQKWASVPRIGNGDPTAVEHWYYALWAYNGWGWVNNPNNPRFSRSGTPATNPIAFPYQERVLYLVAHPPKDANGNPLWKAVPVTLPSKKLIGQNPGALKELHRLHRERPLAGGVIYHPAAIKAAPPGRQESVAVRLTNTGTETWSATGTDAVVLAHHLFSVSGNPWSTFTATSPGVAAFGQSPVALPRDVAPGKSVTLHAVVTLPSTAGLYRVVWDLSQGSGLWFSQSGAPPLAQPVRVLRPGQAAPTPTPSPTALPDPSAGLLYVADTSVPDGTHLKARSKFTKGWLVFNNGKQAWSSGWALHHLSGPTFGAAVIPVPATKGCRSANIAADMQAPKKSGSYTGVWQLEDPSGHRAGDKLTVVISVVGKPSKKPTPTPGPSPTPTAPAHGKPTPTPTAVG